MNLLVFHSLRPAYIPCCKPAINIELHTNLMHKLYAYIAIMYVFITTNYIAAIAFYITYLYASVPYISKFNDTNHKVAFSYC